jgi:acetyl esterase/lipase
MFYLAGICSFAALCIMVPAPLFALIPLTVAAPEISPWLVILNVIGFALAMYFRPRTVPIFLTSLAVCAWPLYEARRLDSHQSWLGYFQPISTGKLQAEILPLNIHYYRPTAQGPRPTLISIYGGAWQRGTPAADAPFHRYFAARGYAVFAVDYRHAPANRFPVQLHDIRAAIRWVYDNGSRYQADVNRIVLCGRSSGGQLALLAAYEDGAVPVRAVIAFYPPTDLVRGYSDPPVPDPIHGTQVLETFLGGPPSAIPELYRQASPASYASRAVPPTLLIQGSRDHVVNPAITRSTFEKLQAAGNHVSLLELPWAEHAFDLVFSGIGSRIAMARIERFLQSDGR